MTILNSTFFLKIACFLMAAGIAFGAFGAHGLADRISSKDLGIFEKAVFYHIVHALALIILNCSSQLASLVSESCLRNTNLLLFFGILIFSGSLYLLVILQQHYLGAITPIGGICFILGWLYLAWNIKSLH